ncbi:MAG: MFS transporter [Burkholderiales bacterium]|nr:MFS transporter [Burkholderiales bacterium]
MHEKRHFPATWMILLAGGLVLGMAMGTRHIQGLFMLPMLAERGWGREAFAFAVGLQTLVWGLLQPVTGMIADRFGTARVIASGCVAYALGLIFEATAPTPGWLAAGVGIVLGAALSATTFATVNAGLARMFPENRRGWAQGIAGAAGGFVQFILVPAGQWSIVAFGWVGALQALACVILLCALAGLLVDDRSERARANSPGVPAQAMGVVVRAALAHRGFWLLNLGFISCGFQLSFLGIHLPAYFRDAGFETAVGVNVIALIALSNAVGTYFCGRLGDLYRRKYLLSAVYALRTLAMIVFVALPLSPASAYLFAMVMGITWLGTVPLTTGVVAQIFGVQYLATLFGLVFLGHQVGGFFGAWLGGVVYDAAQSYAWMWLISIALGFASVLLNLPIDDRSVQPRMAAAPA